MDEEGDKELSLYSRNDVGAVPQAKDTFDSCGGFSYQQQLVGLRGSWSLAEHCVAVCFSTWILTHQLAVGGGCSGIVVR